MIAPDLFGYGAEQLAFKTGRSLAQERAELIAPGVGPSGPLLDAVAPEYRPCACTNRMPCPPHICQDDDCRAPRMSETRYCSKHMRSHPDEERPYYYDAAERADQEEIARNSADFLNDTEPEE